MVRRRSPRQIAQLDQQIIDVLIEDNPQSCRHVFYRMTDPRLPEPVEKSQNGYRQVQDRLTELRRSELVPYGWLVDTSRRGYFINTFANVADFIRRMKDQYRADMWHHADCRCEVWTESRSIAGVIEEDCAELAVTLYPAGGFSSITFAYEAAMNINAEYDRPVVVLYIGDYDPAGVLIDQAIERELRQHLDSRVELEFRRLAVTEDQISQYDLPGKPRKETDRRSLHITETVEAKAMPAAVLRRFVRSNILGLLPEGADQWAMAQERQARATMLKLAMDLSVSR